MRGPREDLHIPHGSRGRGLGKDKKRRMRKEEREAEKKKKVEKVEELHERSVWMTVVPTLLSPNCSHVELRTCSPVKNCGRIMSQFPEVQGGGSLIVAWQVKNKHVVVVGGGEVRLRSASWSYSHDISLTARLLQRSLQAVFSTHSMPMPT